MSNETTSRTLTFRTWLIALFTSCLLFAIIVHWVPVSKTLFHREYYESSLWHRLQPRALTGTLSHALGLTPTGFIILLQLFKLAWLTLICAQFVRHITDRYVALLLCTTFSFSSVIFINDFLTGFVDMVTNSWLLVAAYCIVPYRSGSRTRSRLCAAVVPLTLGLLTHEIAILWSSVLIAWAIMRYRWQAFPMVVLWMSIAGGFLWLAWRKHGGFGFSPATYWRLFAQHAIDLHGVHGRLNTGGILVGGGMLWVVYGVLGYFGTYRQPGRTSRSIYAIWVVFALMANLSGLLMAADTSRVSSGIWLASFILIMEHANAFNERLTRMTAYSFWSMLCMLQLLIPPMAVFDETWPLNSYARYILRSPIGVYFQFTVH